METILIPQCTWTDLFVTAVILLVGYLALVFLQKVLERVATLPRWVQSPLENSLHFGLRFYEPLATLVLLGVFVLIRPGLHGFIAGVLAVSGFSHIRNYLSGQVALLDRNLAVGNRLRSNGVEGVVVKSRRLGLQLRTDEGLHFLPYSRLLSNGYTLVTGEQVGGFYLLDISPKEQTKADAKPPAHAELLEDLLCSAPYLGNMHRPEIITYPSRPNHFTAKVLVDEEAHLREFVELLNERGYSAEIGMP